jgi:serine/threonine protein kinase
MWVTSGGRVLRGLQPSDPPTIGSYRLVGQLGGGGMGRVFLGVSAGGRPVAVKVIRADLATDPQFRVRFGREVAAARRVSGLFTAVVVDADVDGPVPWLATAYVAGPSLSEAVEQHGPLPTGSLLALAAGLAESLTAIHAAGVVHRDLKPSNVMLAEDGPRVIDFGISRAVESTSLTQAGLVIGSPGFMSPEQAMGHEAGPPSDIFNLGGVLAFAATGEGPFGSGTTMALLYRVVHDDPSLDRVPAAMRPLIEHCLAKDPSQRPTADDLLAQVGALQPTSDWLPESIIRAFAGGAQTPTTAPGLVTQATTGENQLLAPRADNSLTATSKSMPVPHGNTLPPPGGAAPARATAPARAAARTRQRWRPMVLAWVIGFIVAASVAGFAVTALTGHPAAPAPSPAAQVSSPTAPASAGPRASGASASSVSASPGVSSSGVSSSARTSSGPGASASASVSASPSASPSVRSSTSATASASSSPSASATPSASVSPSASATPSAAVSPSVSATPSAAVSPSSGASTSPSGSAGAAELPSLPATWTERGFP